MVDSACSAIINRQDIYDLESTPDEVCIKTFVDGGKECIFESVFRGYWNEFDAMTESNMTNLGRYYEAYPAIPGKKIGDNKKTMYRILNSTVREMFQDYTGNKANQTSKMREAVQFVKQKLDSAQWFIDAIKQRQETLQRTMEAIILLQRDFFLTGDDATLRPMILKDVAERAGYDISTISRVSNSKYVQTNFGIYPLKFFFSESMQTDSGEEISTREVKKIMKEHIDSEDKRKPLTDEELTTILKEKGYVIARRTVAKYREQLDIPVARLRKEI